MLVYIFKKLRGVSIGVEKKVTKECLCHFVKSQT